MKSHNFLSLNGFPDTRTLGVETWMQAPYTTEYSSKVNPNAKIVERLL